jgi:hypothetical protein
MQNSSPSQRAISSWRRIALDGLPASAVSTAPPTWCPELDIQS